MLAAVEAVTSTSQWQLPLFNAWGVGWWGGGFGQTLMGPPAMSHVHMSNTYCHTMGYKAATKSINPSRACLCACLC